MVNVSVMVLTQYFSLDVLSGRQLGEQPKDI